MRKLWCIGAALFLSCGPPDAPSDRSLRDAAALRGLRFLERFASAPALFAEHGADLLWAFHTLAESSADPLFKQEARAFGNSLAHRWRAANPFVPPGAGPNELYELASGSASADDLGVINDPMRLTLAAAARRFRPEQFLLFDPAVEPPPADLPNLCDRCRHRNIRGAKQCRLCALPLTMQRPADILFYALLTTYTGHHYGIWLGGNYEDVAQWIPAMRPYPPPDSSITYLITHIIYTLNDYDLFRLRPEWLPAEFAYLKQHAQLAIDQNDPETLGEFVDSLQSFGLSDSDPLVRKGIDYLMARQNPDGSWGNPREPDDYTRYHATWTGIGGVMRYAWRGEQVTVPGALPRLRAR